MYRATDIKPLQLTTQTQLNSAEKDTLIVGRQVEIQDGGRVTVHLPNVLVALRVTPIPVHSLTCE